jgi:prepilin-type N-terminal cleavage/methylation domain-containing protein
MMVNSKGFTLIELMVVLAIISVAYSLVGPNLFNTYKKMQGQAELKEFKDTLNKISYKSFINAREVVLQLNDRSVKYRYIDEPKFITMTMEYVRFPKQEIIFSSAGFTNVSSFSIEINQQLSNISLDEINSL